MSDVGAKVDTRFAISRSCPWFGPLSEATLKQPGRRCCPGCGADLTIFDDDEAFWNLKRLGDLQLPGFLAFSQWLDAEFRTGRHFESFEGTASAYQREVGQSVGPEIAHGASR